MRRIIPVLVLLASLVASLVAVPAAHAWAWPAAGPVLRPFSLGADTYAAGQHRGVDIGAGLGSAVLAPAAGTVSFVGSIPRGGHTVTIQTADGYAVTLLQLGSTSVLRGSVVAEGDIVGAVGESADEVTSAPHVHLGVRVATDPDGYVDPLGLLPALAPPPVPAPPPPVPEPQPPTPPVVVPAPEPAAAAPVVEPAAPVPVPSSVVPEPPAAAVAPASTSIAPRVERRVATAVAEAPVRAAAEQRPAVERARRSAAAVVTAERVAPDRARKVAPRTSPAPVAHARSARRCGGREPEAGRNDCACRGCLSPRGATRCRSSRRTARARRARGSSGRRVVRFHSGSLPQCRLLSSLWPRSSAGVRPGLEEPARIMGGDEAIPHCRRFSSRSRGRMRTALGTSATWRASASRPTSSPATTACGATTC